VEPLATAGSPAAAGGPLVAASWVGHLRPAIVAALERSTGRGSADAVDITVGHGSSWADALADLPWTDDEILVIGTTSSSLGRLFLGSHAAKIVRNAPVPVMLVPRAALDRAPASS
jgi:nucleotide-binding universal stress UspA family protein